MSKLRPSSAQPASTHHGTGRRLPPQQALLPTASPVTLLSASASAIGKIKWVSLVDTTGNMLRDVPLPRPRSIQHQLTAARPKMPYAAVMNRKGINREAAAHFLERLDWMVSQLHLHHAPEHNDGCMSLVQRDPSVSFDGVFVQIIVLC